ncbi:proline and serine-rich protein 3 isoform X2 [Dermochelys coriacea]|uniref:proline and serine-rich protein 3 isoform X2 n=2 Tax=Dermochelys coriacea TaxID=27794 RepID=UPI0018E7531B|nr:proline and serine-rich protein 3 isoform X2 [Dermochelys coriacea]
MESSTALFSVQGSPFAMGSPVRSHYHPSPARLPGPQHQCTALSPAHLLPGVPAIAPHRQRPPEPTASSPQDLSFLQGPSCWGTALDSDSTNPFLESWPSTECSSPSTPQKAPDLRQPLGPLASARDGESIIAKYIERFRHGQPSSRSQRQVPPIPTAREFWWLEPAPPSDSSTPKGGAKPDCAKLEEARPPLCPMGVPSDTSLLESPEPNIRSLQERAARLLLRSESSLSSTIPVSSEGLRSTPPSSIPDSDQVLPSPPHLSLLEPSPGPLPPACWPPAHIPQCSSSTRPEDDILFQWRLRRKMEQASQGGRSLPLLGWKSQQAWGPRTGDGACMTCPGLGLLPGVAAWKSGDGIAFPAPAAQPEVRSGLEWAPGSSVLRQGIGHPLEVPFLSAEPAVRQNPIAVHVLGQLASVATPSNTPQCEGDGGGAAERWSSKDAQLGMGLAEQPSSRDSRQGAGPSERPASQDARRAAGPSERAGSQDARRAAGLLEWAGSRDARRGVWAVGVAQNILKETQQPSKPQPSQGRAALEPEATRSWRRRNRKGKSSIHSALGQVISERLFSPTASPHPTRGHQSGQGAVSPSEQGAAGELPAPGSQHPQLLQLAAQLLEEAEESDGTEFEEDPLLEVLRGQREDLRSQLRAVDIAVSRLVSQGLAELPGRPC